MNAGPAQPVSDRFCLIDIGSTTTKCAYVRTGAPLVRCEAPTTVEQPWEDVRVGVMNCLRHLQESTGDQLTNGENPVVPLYVTSSAGGGLVMVVAGLVQAVTAASAKRAAYGAGAVVRETIALDDGRPPYQKIELLRRLQPDMILLAGGFDGGAEFGPVFLSELLAQADLRCKFDPAQRPPVLYAGNASAYHFVREILEPRYLCLKAANLRPSAYRENLEPTHDAIHDIFMEHVMSRAPGYTRLAELVAAPIMPTPAAMARLLGVVSEELKLRILTIDIGGATTDVFTASNGQVERTVSANLGMSYSALNVVEQYGADSLRAIMENRLEGAELLDLVGNKYLRPVRLPSTGIEREGECALGAVAIREAVRAHLRVVQKEALSRSRDGLGYGRQAVSTLDVATDAPLDLRGYDMIIGSGGILSHSPRDTSTAMLINALAPTRPVHLAVDSDFVFPQLGVLAGFDRIQATRLFQEIGLARLGRLVPCKGRHKEGATAVEISLEAPDGQHRREVRCGEAALFPDDRSTGEVVIEKRRLKPLERLCAIGPDTPRVIVDARNRPPVAPFPWNTERNRRESARINCEWERQNPFTGELREIRELAVPGEVLVQAGDTVEPDMLVARSTRVFPRPFMLDVARYLGVDAETARAAVCVKIGDSVKVRDQVAELRPEMLARGSSKSLARRFGLIPSRGRTSMTSTVSGTVEKILPNATIVLRESLDRARDVRRVNAAEQLQLHPEELPPCLVCREGQDVEKGQVLARRGHIAMLAAPRSVSPVRGRVRSIDADTGIITIEPIMEALQVRAWLPGRVATVSDRGCTISLRATVLPGIWGSGEKVCARLSIDTASEGDAAAFERASRTDLEWAAANGVAGIIAGSVRLADLREVAPKYAIVITEGFGTEPMHPGLWAQLRPHSGQPVALDPTTRLRAGVVRPRIILPLANDRTGWEENA